MRFRPATRSMVAVCTATLLSVTFNPNGAHAATPPPGLDTAISDFSQAYRNWDRTALQSAAAQLGTLSETYPESFEVGYWHGVSRLHLLLHLHKSDPDRITVEQVDAVLETIDAVLQRHPGQGELHAMLGTLYGLRITTRRWGAIRDGRRFQNQFRLALKAAPDNPRVNYLYGRALMSGPSMLGGPDLALKHFRNALDGFEAEHKAATAASLPSWGHSHTLSGIGWLHLQAGDNESAAAAFRSALRLNPNETEAREGLMRIEQP